MSVIKMIVADDQHYVAGELHDSGAQCVYAACSRNPKSLDELDKLLPEFGTDRRLRELFHRSASLELEPLGAGLIVVDLAKKWIFAEVTAFSASRRGGYVRGDNKGEIEYEFSSDWQFVAEAKWFRYLNSANLTPHANRHSGVQYVEISWNDLMKALEERDAQRQKFYEGILENMYLWDKESDKIRAAFADRSRALTEMKPQDAGEETDLQTLERILEEDKKAAIARHRIEMACKELASDPAEFNWLFDHPALKALDKHLAIWQSSQREAEAQSAELRKLRVTERFRAVLQARD